MDTTRFSLLRPSFDADAKLLVLVFEHGKANEIGTAELDAFEQLCDVLECDDTVRCLCATSRRVGASGKPIFVSGANVTERIGWDKDRVKTHVHRQRLLMERIRRLPLFTCALSHGVTLGWGTEFVLATDWLLATPTASFALPETGLGIVPGAGGTAHLALRVGFAQACRLGCVGESIDALEAHRIGLVQELVESVDDGLARVVALARSLRRRSPTAVALYKRAMLDALGRPSGDRVRIEQDAYDACVELGEADIGRAAFAAIRAGEEPPWGKRNVGRTAPV